MATAEPLTPAWIANYKARLVPGLSPIQRLAVEHVWSWFEDLWDSEQVDADRLRDLMAEIPLLEEIEDAPDARDPAIVRVVEALRSIDHDVVRGRG